MCLFLAVLNQYELKQTLLDSFDCNTYGLSSFV